MPQINDGFFFQPTHSTTLCVRERTIGYGWFLWFLVRFVCVSEPRYATIGCAVRRPGHPEDKKTKVFGGRTAQYFWAHQLY